MLPLKRCGLILRWSQEILKGEDGQGLVEYAFILLLVAVVVVAALTAIGLELKAFFESIAPHLGL